MDDDQRRDAPVAPPGYEPLVRIGRGGTATVYRSRREGDAHHVAIKVFDADQETSAQRQCRAAHALAGIGGVVEVLDGGSLDDGRSYLVFPLFDGGSMAQHVERDRALPASEVAELGASLADALEAAHRADVLHRDLKPSNILLTGSGDAALGDFGAATVTDSGSGLDTTTATATLTLLYAAPEVLEGAAADERSDQYSLGLTLLAVAMGRHPFAFDGSTGALAPLVNRICVSGVTEENLAGLPAGLAAVLRRATALDPDDRYANAAELARDLREVATDAVRIPAKAMASARRRSGRRPQLLMAAGVAVAVAVVVGLVVWQVRDDGVEVSADVEVSTTTGATTTTISTAGPAVTEANGLLGRLYQQDEFAYAGQLSRECEEGERLVALAIHASDDDRRAGIAEPWNAVGSPEAGTFMAYFPCESGGRNIRYVLRAPGRWFTVVAEFPLDQYDRMVGWMRENETSEAPDYTVDDPIRATLAIQENYVGWSTVDRAE